MSRPTRVKVGHQVFRIKWLTEKQWQQDPHCEEEESGNSWWGSGVIAIRLETMGHAHSLAALQEVLLHEILHMCWEVGAVGVKGEVQSDAYEEMVVRNLSYPLVAALQDNPKVFEYLTQKG